MQRLNIIFLFLITALFSNGYAQKKDIAKVSFEELQQKVHPKDTTAVAAILFKVGEVSFDYFDNEGFVMITKVKTRIKIYKKEGYEWANHKIGYYLVNDAREKASFSDAYTYNLEDGKIVKTKLKSDGEFDQKINKYWGQKSITMPNIKEGSVIEYEYEIQSPNFGVLPEWNFQTSIPVDYSEFKTSIPEYFVYKPNQKGTIFPQTSVEKLRKSIIFNSKERNENSVGVPTVTYSQDVVDYELAKTTNTLQNLPAMKDEVFVNNVNNYTSSIAHELSMTKFPNRPIKSFSTDWESLTKTIYDNEDFGPELNKTGYFDDDINVLIAGKSNQAEKAALIFNFVKSNVKWNEYYGFLAMMVFEKLTKTKQATVPKLT